ncbi:diacylglycerol kinase [Massilia sp. DWR3-1-1]|uniref:diacylglycerol kinase n=1 Tax=Massilia sp. DWR3-1-1 TaxID=2804559 RepID=UPI003CF249B9
MKNQPFHRRFGFAVQGLAAAWRGEASFRFQCLACAAVLAVLLWRQPAPLWWALLLTMCALVLAAELFNTAFEAALDHLHPGQHPAIGMAKDCAAAAVLVLSLASAAVFCAFLFDNF